MKLSTVLASSAVLVALLAPGTRAEDPPAGDAAKPGPPWTAKGIAGHLAVSSDGAWVAARAVDGFRLFPAAGGDPVVVALGKDETVRHFEFSADSKWLVAAGLADDSLLPGADHTQPVLVFPVAAPSKRRTYKVKLQAAQLDKELRRRAPELGNVRTYEGAVRDLVPLTGSRMHFDRGRVGVELWDVATGAKFAAPAAIEGTSTCGLSADGTRCVVTTTTGLEIRDVKLNRVLQSIPIREYADLSVIPRHPVFAEDGAAVLVERHTMSGAPGAGVAIDCWNLADGKLRWTAPLAKEGRVESLSTGGGCAIVVDASAGASLHLFDLRDGKPAVHAYSKKSVYGARPTADGRALWIVDGNDTLTKLEFPPLTAK